MLVQTKENMSNTTNTGEIKRVGKFGAVGIINTLIDLTFYNILSSSIIGLSLIGANLISTTIAMVFSFFANQRLVFNANQRGLLRQALIFFPVTAFGLYVLQSGVIKLFTEVWLAPLELAVLIVHFVGLSALFSDDFIIKNGAKAAATLVSLTWNYLMYKKVVFKS